ncbi:MAG: 50S ribosomal protein L14 [Candidatus Micrarchaeota archaeon]|nr:50S ribosomal protein L14 [Candidatus Micrarchaeota archaeon]
MKAVRAKVVKTLTTGTYLKCDDNSGAKVLMIIGVEHYKGVRGRYPRAGVGDVVICSVKKGDPKLVGTVVKAVIIRQKKEFNRRGYRVAFEDNAAVVINEEGIPVGTEVKGVVAREAAERFPKVAGIAQGVV